MSPRKNFFKKKSMEAEYIPAAMQAGLQGHANFKGFRKPLLATKARVSLAIEYLREHEVTFKTEKEAITRISTLLGNNANDKSAYMAVRMCLAKLKHKPLFE